MGCSNVKDKNDDQQDQKKIDENAPEEIKAVANTAEVDIKPEEENVIVTVNNEGGVPWTMTFSRGQLIKDAIQEYIKSHPEIPNTEGLKWMCNGVEMNINDTMLSLLPQEKNIRPVFSYVIPKFPLLSNNSLVPCKLLGKPLSDPFEVFVFSAREKTIQLAEFNKDDIENNELNNFNRHSAYCNGGDLLFLSGGETNGIELGLFWTIKLEDKTIYKHDTGIKPRKCHSMIYIPQCYVFIIGGFDNEVIYFDANMNTFHNCGMLNLQRIEPTLCYVDNRYLYVLDNLKSEAGKNTFEFIDLRNSDDKQIWNLIEPQIPESTGTFDQVFFGSVPIGLNNESQGILMLGGNMNKPDEYIPEQDKVNYIYDINNNIIVKSEINFIDVDLHEKSMIQLDLAHWCLISSCGHSTPSMLVFSATKGKLKHIKFNVTAPMTNLIKKSTKIINDNKAQMGGMENMSNSIKLSCSLIPSFQSKKYNFNMPNLSQIKEDVKEDVKEEVKENDNINVDDINVNVNANVDNLNNQFEPNEQLNQPYPIENNYNQFNMNLNPEIQEVPNPENQQQQLVFPEIGANPGISVEGNEQFNIENNPFADNNNNINNINNGLNQNPFDSQNMEHKENNKQEVQIGEEYIPNTMLKSNYTGNRRYGDNGEMSSSQLMMSTPMRPAQRKSRNGSHVKNSQSFDKNAEEEMKKKFGKSTSNIKRRKINFQEQN